MPYGTKSPSERLSEILEDKAIGIADELIRSDDATVAEAIELVEIFDDIIRVYEAKRNQLRMLVYPKVGDVLEDDYRILTVTSINHQGITADVRYKKGYGPGREAKLDYEEVSSLRR